MKIINGIKEEIASPIDIVHNKHCYDKLRYFINVYYGLMKVNSVECAEDE